MDHCGHRWRWAPGTKRLQDRGTVSFPLVVRLVIKFNSLVLTCLTFFPSFVCILTLILHFSSLLLVVLSLNLLLSFLILLPVLLRRLQRWSRGRGPAGLPAPLERPGPSEPHLPLPPLRGLGRPKRREQLPKGAALPGCQRRGAELWDQPVHQSRDRWLLCEFTHTKLHPDLLKAPCHWRWWGAVTSFLWTIVTMYDGPELVWPSSSPSKLSCALITLEMVALQTESRSTTTHSQLKTSVQLWCCYSFFRTF